ncbi:MAG: DUF2079 domain-containing protein [Leptolyngbyaceae cyanobacterium bins.302]|nr:DUF2079 domain-containing protein [Leptolyngbyaceae cyanobacterium bins.302]
MAEGRGSFNEAQEPQQAAGELLTLERDHKGEAAFRQVGWLIAGSMIVLFVCSSVRHRLFQSTAFDLGFFDQATYLISQGQPPIISFWGFHVMGGHADWILYPIALFYKLYPSVYWLLAIQAIALSLGALPTWYLARQAGLKPDLAKAVAIAYLLYPLIFNLNLFDFHPEVIALPLFLTSVLAARAKQIGWFTLCIVLILGCRDALALTVAALGIWLALFERRRGSGAIAVLLGISWFLIATKLVIPAFRPGGVESVWRFAYLGNSLPEILLNLVLKPHLVLPALFTLKNLEYLVLLFAPVAWGLSFAHLAPLLPLLPTLGMNLLSTVENQKDLLHQYSLPAVPFLLLAAIASLSHGKGLLHHPRHIVLYSLVGFLALAKFGYFGSRYLAALDTWQATRTALTYIDSNGSILTTAYITPHVTHRPVVKVAIQGSEDDDLSQFQYVLLNLRHPGWMSDRAVQQTLVDRLQQDSRFKQQLHQDDVFLFVHGKG